MYLREYYPTQRIEINSLWSVNVNPVPSQTYIQNVYSGNQYSSKANDKGKPQHINTHKTYAARYTKGGHENMVACPDFDCRVAAIETNGRRPQTTFTCR